MTATTQRDSALRPLTLSDILQARQVVARYLPPTPVIRPPALDEVLGCEVVLKLESMQPIGAFKVRGGVYLMSQLSADERECGVVTASSGNHGQSLCYAGRLFGVRNVIVFVPVKANPNKVAAIRRLGGTIMEVEGDIVAEAERYAAAEGLRYVHPCNEPLLFAGVGTYALELIEAAPHLDVVIAPVGGGSGVCGVATVFKAMRPETKVIAVQTENMPAVYRSSHERRIVSVSGGHTFADGLTTTTAYELPFGIMQRLVDDVMVVSEQELREALVMYLDTAHIVAEGAAAAPLAAACKLGTALHGKRVGLIVSGGNITLDTLRGALCAEDWW